MRASGLRQHEDSGSPRGRKAPFHLWGGTAGPDGGKRSRSEGETEREQRVKAQRARGTRQEQQSRKNRLHIRASLTTTVTPLSCVLIGHIHIEASLTCAELLVWFPNKRHIYQSRTQKRNAWSDHLQLLGRHIGGQLSSRGNWNKATDIHLYW